MLFNSFHFVVFFPLVVAIYYATAERNRWIVLLAASCYFYMAFIPRYILVLLTIITIDYFAGVAIQASRSRRRKLLLATSIAANLGVLVIFKYLDFFDANLSQVAQFVGIRYTPSPAGFILPLGLSFHTFQSLSYTIEVYRGNFPAERNFGRYALYVMFFPQLVAGPIERPQNLLPQLERPALVDNSAAVSALRLMLLGFAKKLLVADNLATPVEAVYSNLAASTGPAIILATYCFAIQIYCDFSGYTDIARGSARLLGVELIKNFNRPYVSQSVSEFWRRWHISLSTWFRDYLYVPLNRSATLSRYPTINLFIVFLLSGLWHGARWTYVVWGAVNACFIALHRALRRTSVVNLPKFLKIFFTFNLICAGWVFFRATSIRSAFIGFGRITVGWRAPVANLLIGLQLSRLHAVVLVCFVGVLLTFESMADSDEYRDKFLRAPRALRWAAYYAVLLLIGIFGLNASRQFIYFQF
jgi:alginate O-acetyltransferase complex protein AlgI